MSRASMLGYADPPESDPDLCQGCGHGMSLRGESTGYCDPCAQEMVQDALRWRALVGCERVRVLGWAGLNDPESPYAHIGLELWTRHEFKDENAANRETLTRFADRARGVPSGERSP